MAFTPLEEGFEFVPIKTESDIVRSRKVIRTLASKMGFRLTDVTRIVTAASELARNIYKYADQGQMCYRELQINGKLWLELVFEDQGPGIEDVEMAMGEGYSSSGSLGLGLPGTKRLVDEMEIESEAGVGTRITLRKKV
ncbi:MAG: anti-sigma regulatory factor [bacterium]|nr:anti-sigma regulatory factor [bacterium]